MQCASARLQAIASVWQAGKSERVLNCAARDQLGLKQRATVALYRQYQDQLRNAIIILCIDPVIRTVRV